MVGRPAILIPYPHATDNHQAANAKALAAAGAAWVMTEREMTPASLGTVIADRLTDASALTGAAAHAREFGRPDAVARLVTVARDLVTAEEAA